MTHYLPPPKDFFPSTPAGSCMYKTVAELTGSRLAARVFSESGKRPAFRSISIYTNYQYPTSSSSKPV